MINNAQILINKKPFNKELDENSFYYFPALKQRINILNRLFTGLSSLVLVVGEAGSGKTLLLKQFLAFNEKDWKKCRINASICSEQKENELIEGVQEHSAYINNKGELPVIMMDNAEKLTAEELLFLVKMAGARGYTRHLKQLIFFCEPDLIKLLTSLEDAVPEDSAVEKIYMPFLSHNETKEYIGRRLCATGFKGNFPFTRNDINSIFEKSGGVPGKINEFAAGQLEKKFNGKSRLASFFRHILRNTDYR